MFMPAENMQKDFAYQHKFNIYGMVGHSHDTSNYIAWFQLNCMKDESTVDGFSKKLDIVRYKVDEDVRDIPID